MAELKTIGITTVLLMLMSAGTYVAVDSKFWETPHYWCESKTSLGIQECSSLTKYGVDNGQCNRVNQTAIRCSTGWSRIYNDDVNDTEYKIYAESFNKQVPEDCEILGCLQG